MPENVKDYLRDVIGNYMTELGRKDERVSVVTADLMGTCRIKSFNDEYPERSFNVGIAEQNMVSFSAGLAHEGLIPYAFSMAPFISMRACEQCRTDIAYANINVRLMATYAGCSGGISGATHWSLEDCAIMSSFPNMTVLEVSDSVSAVKLLDETLIHNGPVYFRSGIVPVQRVYDENDSFVIGGSKECCSGCDGAFLCSGVVVQHAIEASELIFKKTGRRIRVVDMYSIKPIDRNAVTKAVETGNIIVAQDHSVIGGLGSMVACSILENKNNSNINFKILGITDEFSTMAHPDYLYKKYHIDSMGLCDEMIKMFNKE